MVGILNNFIKLNILDDELQLLDWSHLCSPIHANWASKWDSVSDSFFRRRHNTKSSGAIGKVREEILPITWVPVCIRFKTNALSTECFPQRFLSIFFSQQNFSLEARFEHQNTIFWHNPSVFGERHSKSQRGADIKRKQFNSETSGTSISVCNIKGLLFLFLLDSWMEKFFTSFL